MRFLLDVHVGHILADYLRSREHEVFLASERTMPGTGDAVIVADADQLGAVVVTWNRKHFAPLISRDPKQGNVEFPNAGLIVFTRCKLVDAVRLLDNYIEEIEFHYQRRQALEDRRVIVEISHKGMMIF